MIKRRALVYKKNCAQFNCKNYLFAACLTLASPFMVHAEAPVVDDSDNFVVMDEQQGTYQSPASRKYAYETEDTASYSYQDEETPLAIDDGAKNTDNNEMKLPDIVKNLQKEIQELRGQLEVQDHELKKLKEQQLSFYKDVDTRLQTPTITAKKASEPTPSAAVPNSANPEPVPSPAVSAAPTGIPGKTGAYIKGNVVLGNPAEEKNKYLAAYEFVKNKHNDQATSALQEFIVLYPKGAYTANAHYWLGELYMVKNNYPKAIEQFAVVLDQFPQSGKSAASTLKLGYALAASGKTVEARQRLQQVINNYPGTSVAQLAIVKLNSLRVS